LDWSYTQRRKPAEGGDRGSDDRKKTRGEETIGYAERVSERIVICGTKNKGGKQELVENMEAKNLPNGRPLTTTRVSMTVGCHIRLRPALQVMRVVPSGLLPSERSIPCGSLIAGKPALFRLW